MLNKDLASSLGDDFIGNIALDQPDFDAGESASGEAGDLGAAAAVESQSPSEDQAASENLVMLMSSLAPSDSASSAAAPLALPATTSAKDTNSGEPDRSRSSSARPKKNRLGDDYFIEYQHNVATLKSYEMSMEAISALEAGLTGKAILTRQKKEITKLIKKCPKGASGK